MEHLRLRGVWLIVCLATLATPAKAQPGVVVSRGSGSVAIDASRLNSVIVLDAPWRFCPRDELHFADPNFDDSGWPLVQPAEDRSPADEHALAKGEDGWMRLQARILHASGPLAILVTGQKFAQYAVFANGKLIGATKGFASGTAYISAPFRLVLPPATDVTLAIHFRSPHRELARRLPLEKVEIGQKEAVGALVDLRHYRFFEETWLADSILSVIFLAFVPLGLTLLFAQRNHPEYLWLALYCLLSACDYSIFPAMQLGRLPVGDLMTILQSLFNTGVLVVGLEFVAALADLRRRWALRIGQAAMLLCPVVRKFATSVVYTQLFRAQYVFFLLAVTYILVKAYRRGRKECGLLLLAILSQVPLTIFGVTGRLHLGGVGVAPDDVSSALLICGILAVVLYRFIRVSKNEEITAAELHAAHTVQQLLISETPPATPGFSVESVYVPAHQVGGDFFFVLPAPEGSGETNLLAIIGDVSGKGLQAAIVVATIMGGLRTQLSRAPAEVLSHLNRILTGHISGFATCCAVLIHQDGRMQIANAGNPSPYCDGEEVATLPGLPLGLDDGAVYEETDHVLSVGNCLAFVSDGVVEATSFPGKELFGFDRTRAISTQSARAIAEAAGRFGAGALQADDITVLTIRYTGT